MSNQIKYMFQGFLFVLIFIGILVLTYYALKFINKKMSISSNNTMEVISGLPLSQNKGIYIIRILTNYYIVGLGEQITLLSRITDEEELEILKNIQNGESLTLLGTDFSKILSEQFSKFSNSSRGEDQ
ncbi:Flagellar biogenesis protein FliO [Anaerobranca californiensis DSM 14826]|uniref:Flagellar biogenesis protein FliO n=1 Tax=Anaerobranca californiensis DSM 14826 TaxID=1120989 RepID=A0A1M6KI02_9FIRM|nr:flagellar biosynthetic protein FliO [Anaerobranca californiensis]SHJ58586.1 Flagellar biogenesis protein FliO [Anaerobranca californiensis DSM 14826]